MTTPQRIVVNLPGWIGDVVMATPALRALRRAFPSAHIAYLLKPYVAGVVDGSPWHDDRIEYAGKSTKTGRPVGFLTAVSEVAKGRFDLGVLLSNSFQSALLMRLAGVRRRVGYDRDGRSLLLSDRLVPYREHGRYIPQPMVRYYLGLTKYLGAGDCDPRPELFLTPQEQSDALGLLKRKGVDPGRPYVALNPGSAFGSAKMWGPDKFAAVADEFVRRGRQVVVLCGPKEAAIGQAIQTAMKHREGVANFAAEPTTIGAVKAVVAGCELLVTNDTGPRHFGIAFDRPVVTIFGSSDPAWTECNHPKEIQIRARVHCSPCMLRTCPIDHRCMTRVTPAMVLEAADILYERFVSGAPARAAV
jgi:heptosyltransferase-2